MREEDTFQDLSSLFAAEDRALEAKPFVDDVMGKVRRGLALMSVSGEAPAVGTPVTVEGASVGSVTSVAALPGRDGLALAVLRKPHDTPGAVMELGSSRGTVIPRPYRLT